MQLIPILIIALAAPMSAYASELCTRHGILAETIMEARQAGVPQRQAAALTSAIDNSTVKNLADAMVEEAYKAPRTSSELGRTIEARLFSIRWEMKCEIAMESE